MYKLKKYPNFFILSVECKNAIAKFQELQAQLQEIGLEPLDLIMASQDKSLRLNGNQIYNIFKSDFCIINGCAIVEYCENNILKWCEKLIKINPELKILTIGCWAAYKIFKMGNKASPNSYNLNQKIKLFRNNNSLFDYIYNRLIQNDIELGKTKQVETKQNDTYSDLILIRDGCDKFCSYCILPYTSLVAQSRFSYSLLDIIKKIREKQKRGINEIRFAGFCYSSWVDKKYGMKFIDLIKLILKKTSVKIKGLEFYPTDINGDLISLISGNNKIDRHIRIPIQHYSGRVLRLMNRKYSKAFLDNLFLKLSKTNLLITTEIIVGFPSETEEDIEELIDFLKRFKNWHEIVLCQYSSREGSSSFLYKPEIADKIKRDRCLRIIREITGKSLSFKDFIKKRIVVSDGFQIKD